MKTFYSLLLAMTMLFVGNVFAFVSSPISNSFDAAGSISHYDKTWVKVKNGSGSSIARGYMVVPDLTADDAATIKLSTASVFQEQPVCMMDEVCAAGAMCKCLRYGYTDQLRFDGASTATAGYGIFLGSATAGMVSYQAVADIPVSGKRIGAFLDASAALAQVEALIDL